MKKGEKMSEEACLKMSESHAGVKLSKGHAANIGRALTVPLRERFWSKVDIRGDHKCWEWMAAKDQNGYGRIGADKPQNGTILAHRAAYELTNGEILKGLFVCHKCDNPSCCNPRHLYAGTHKENMKDMTDRGRGSNQNKNATHCKRGHEFNKKNTGIDGRENRFCKACQREHHIRHRKEKEALNESA